MKGDNNDAADGGPYYVGETTWTPRWQFSGAGTVVAALTERSVVVPLVIALLAMFLLTLVPRDEDDDGDSDGQQAVTEDDPGGVAAPVPDDQARVDQLASAAPPAERGGSM